MAKKSKTDQDWTQTYQDLVNDQLKVNADKLESKGDLKEAKKKKKYKTGEMYNTTARGWGGWGFGLQDPSDSSSGDASAE